MTKQLDAPLMRLCGLWEQTGRSGQTYLTGRLNFGTPPPRLHPVHSTGRGVNRGNEIMREASTNMRTAGT
jgi:hypothetical protein